MTRPRRIPAARAAAALLLAVAFGCADDAPERPAATPPASPAPATDTAAAADSAIPDTAAADTGPVAVTDPTEAAPWTTSPVLVRSARGQAGVATLRNVRVGRHDGYDRIVFEFDDHVPDYDVRWVDDPTGCGSGEPVDVGAPAALQVGFRPAVAHDEEGRITVRERAFRPGLPALRTARISCDFEADVTWVLGVAARVEMRVLRLASPPRVVVDLRHR